MSSLLSPSSALRATAVPGLPGGPVPGVQAPWLMDSAGGKWTSGLSDGIIICGMYPGALGRSAFLLRKARL